MTGVSEGNFLSVVVPAYQRPERLLACLRALRLQVLPAERFEVIIVNDGGASPAALIAKNRGSLNVRLVESENAGPAAARNAGAALARGALIAFTDDDCLPTADWLSNLRRAAGEAPHHLIGGAMVNVLTDDVFASTTQLIVSSVYEYRERTPGMERLFNTSNMLVPAKEFRELGGFSEDFPLAAGEDYDFCARWHRAGLPSLYLSNAVVGHAHPLNFAGFCRQHFNYGRGLLRFRKRAARSTGVRFRVESPGFYMNLMTYPLRQGLGARGVLHAALVALSQAATASGAVAEMVSPSRRRAEPAVERSQPE